MAAHTNNPDGCLVSTINSSDGAVGGPQSDEVLNMISRLVRTVLERDHIYRGEPECYQRVASSLYRHYIEIESDGFDIERVQREIVEAARQFTTETDEEVILAQLQHYGWYGTNLIDFTTDLNIALFFACDGHHDEDGRIVLLAMPNPNIDYPNTPSNRVIAQKSVFVRPPKGFVEPDGVFIIPKHLKQSILSYLDRCHGISAKTLYNDLHGFNRYYQTHQSAYGQFHLGITKRNQNDQVGAIRHFTECIRLNPNEIRAYRNRALLYLDVGEHDLAMADYAKAIESNPQDPTDYFLRGFAHMHMREYRRAIDDFDVAIGLEPTCTFAYVERGKAMGKVGEFFAAIRDFDKALELNPDDPKVYALRGKDYATVGDHGRAIQDFTTAIDLDPNVASTYFNRALSHIVLKADEPALLDFETVINLLPDVGHGYWGRAMMRLMAKRWGEARFDLNAACSRDFDVAGFFCIQFQGVKGFEETYLVNLPNEIAELVEPECRTPRTMYQ